MNLVEGILIATISFLFGLFSSILTSYVREASITRKELLLEIRDWATSLDKWIAEKSYPSGVDKTPKREIKEKAIDLFVEAQNVKGISRARIFREHRMVALVKELEEALGEFLDKRLSKAKEDDLLQTVRMIQNKTTQIHEIVADELTSIWPNWFKSLYSTWFF